MERRWGLQAKMTATYVAVTAGAVLLTELVIFGVAALSPPAPLTPQAVQGLAQATAEGMAAKLGNLAGKAGHLRNADLSTTGAPVPLGQAQPDGNGVAIAQLATPDCDLAPASFAVVVDRAYRVLAARVPTGRRACRGRSWRRSCDGRWRAADTHHCRPATSCGRRCRSC